MRIAHRNTITGISISLFSDLPYILDTIINPVIQNRHMYAEIKELLFSPNTFFGRKAGAEINLVPPAIIVLIVSIVSILSPYVGNYLSPRVSGPVNVILMPDSFLIILFRPFIAWILISCILYGLCRWFSGTGTFMATLQNTGYCVLPLTIFTVIMLIGDMAAVQFMAIPYSMVFEVTLGVVLLSLLFIIWSGDLLIFAMEKTHAIPHSKAIVAVVIAAVILAILDMIIIPRLPYLLSHLLRSI